MQGNYYGMPTGVVENEFVRVEYLLEAGPRLVRLVPKASGKNLFAELPEAGFDTPSGRFELRGGHRLWHAPEVARRTYVPDNEAVIVTEMLNGVRLDQPMEAPTGIAKSITVELDGSRPRLTIHHTLRNHNLWAVELAPWAISQMRLGGSAVIPQQVGPIDPDGLLSNRQLTLWAYSHLRDLRLILDDDMIVIDAHVRPDAFKLGTFNPHGWMGYFLDDCFFIKRFGAEQHAPYPDGGSNCELYINDAFLELESLGPLLTLQPGAEVSHSESWELHTGITAPTELADLKSLAQALADQAV